jgi:NTP pyrophosphatase (non-canonical NTP hydrolase)
MTKTPIPEPFFVQEAREHAAVPAWKRLADDVEGAAHTFAWAAEELIELLDRFSREDNIPEDVKEAAEDVGLEVRAVAAGIERRLLEFQQAVAAEDDDGGSPSAA